MSYLYIGGGNNTVLKITESCSYVWTSADLGSTPKRIKTDLDGYIYVGLTSGFVKKLDPSDGSIIWSSPDFGVDANGLAVDLNNNVYVGAADNKVRKLDPADGSVVWTSNALTDNVLALVADFDGYLYAGNTFGFVEKLNASDGSIVSGWSTPTLDGIVNDLTIDLDGYIYASAGTYIYQIDPSDGSILDSGTLSYPMREIAASTDGWIYGSLANNIDYGVFKWKPVEGFIVNVFGQKQFGCAITLAGYAYTGSSEYISEGYYPVRKLNPSDLTEHNDGPFYDAAEVYTIAAYPEPILQTKYDSIIKGGSNTTVEINPEGSGTKYIISNSESTVQVETEQAGKKKVSTGSESSVTISSEGDGESTSISGSESIVVIQAEGLFKKYVSGGSESTVVVNPEGEGIPLAGNVIVEIKPEGAGIKGLSGGSESELAVSTEQAGIKRSLFGSESEIDISAEGSFSKAVSGDAESIINVLVQGGGHEFSASIVYGAADIGQYLNNIRITGRGLAKERTLEEIPGADPLETAQLQKLNKITINANIIATTHSQYRTKVAALKSALAGTTQRELSFVDDTRTWNAFVERLRINPHKPVSNCLSADVEIRFVGRCVE